VVGSRDESCRQTGAFVIAEGIEDGDTLQFLRGIDERELSSHTIIQGGQGFGLGEDDAVGADLACDRNDCSLLYA
jgi:hypothetical protein